jgi:hypothetical protein
MDWVKQLITKTQITCDNSKMKELDSILRCYPDANYILKIYSPNKVEECHMYYNKEPQQNQPKILNVILFRTANLSDYHYQHSKFRTEHTKHVR